MTAGNDVGDDVGNDVGDRDDGGNDAGTMLAKGVARTLAGRGGGAPDGGCSGGGGGSSNVGGGGCILQGSVAFYCEDIIVWYIYDIWGESARSHLPSHSRHA